MTRAARTSLRPSIAATILRNVPSRADVRSRATERLRAQRVPPPALDADVLLAHALSISKETLVAHPEVELTTAEELRYAGLIERRVAGVPVAYLRGFKEFYGLRFAVDGRVLVPRPETEVLVDAVRAHVARRALTAVDVGTGSGAIAGALAVNEPQLPIIATAVSADGLAGARAHAAPPAARVALSARDL